MRLEQDTPKHSATSVWLLRILVLGLILAAWFAVNTLNQTSQSYDDTLKALGDAPTVAKTTELNGKKLVIPNYSMFRQGQLWALVSKERPLKGEAGYTLVDAPVAHGDSTQPMKVAEDIVEPLKALVGAASADDEDLMISSAYRSLEEQQKTYDSYVAECGTACAKQYVMPVGASEHHTGLAVDFSSRSDKCAADSDDCSLGASSAAWLAKNAWKYGFIQRYPAGKQSITGVSSESWHYRYVGIVMATAMHDSGLTYDEVVQQLAPGYAKSGS